MEKLEDTVQGIIRKDDFMRSLYSDFKDRGMEHYLQDPKCLGKLSEVASQYRNEWEETKKNARGYLSRTVDLVGSTAQLGFYGLAISTGGFVAPFLAIGGVKAAAGLVDNFTYGFKQGDYLGPLKTLAREGLEATIPFAPVYGIYRAIAPEKFVDKKKRKQIKDQVTLQMLQHLPQKEESVEMDKAA